jgi:molecular chaperone DnaK (HSP70)
MSARHVVGIDLGTTHVVVASARVDSPLTSGVAMLFPLPQLVAAGQVAARPLLPSFRYHPAAGEFSPADAALPWAQVPVEGDAILPVVGEWARDLGAKRLGQSVASAKSWLSHDQVDRTAAILPWGVEESVKVSPVVASASYLRHVRDAWDNAHPDAPLASQEVVLTVPASFDEAARACTLEAARLAGLASVRLLEEPQAVCYDWYLRHLDSATEALQGARLMLVVDVGGGTTDLSLIRLEAGEGGLQLTRIAVGDHLMLGGDNLDLAIARLVEPRLCSEGQRLGPAALGQVLQQARIAKERLLAVDGPEETSITLLGSGSRLVGGSRSATISREAVRQLAFDGFLPLTGLDELPARKRSAVSELGLPYVADPAISRHLAAFLALHAEASRAALGIGDDQPAVPDCVIGNGGFFQTPLLRERLLEVLGHWAGRPVRALDNPHPDQSVALGAVAFGLLRRQGRRTIGGGAARSFFLLVDDAQGQRQAVCLLPKGSGEGVTVSLPGRRFALTLGQPASFPLASFSGGKAWQAGEITDASSDGFVFLPPLMTRLEAEGASGSVTVSLAAQITGTGLLQVDCIAEGAGGRQWSLEFPLRRSVASVDSSRLPSGFGDASALLAEVFVRSDRQFDPKRVKQVRDELERWLRPRDEWDLALSRALFDELLKGMSKRRRSAAHERLWFNLAGFTLRPGFGYPLDDWRLEQVWALWEQGLQYGQESQAWAEWWTFWRRLSGGLDEARQLRLLQAVEPYLNPAHGRNSKIQTELKVRSLEDMIRLAGSLENLPGERKAALGHWFVQRLSKAGESPTTWWALGRLGARVPFHGSTHGVLPPAVVTSWIDLALREDWKKTPQAAFATVMMSRMSGDRARDIDDALRQKVLAKLRVAKASALWTSLVSENLSLDEADNRRVFGEGLPVGLRLLQGA